MHRGPSMNAHASFPSRLRTLVLAHVLVAAACGSPEPGGPLRIAVVIPAPMGIHGVDPPTDMSPHPNLSWAVDQVNAAGGPAGRKLSLDFVDTGDPMAMMMTVDAEKERDTK